ncbi:hypothetical protein [Microbulbifer hydrolyticus]|uniref:Uncharacterized protein n=1 Tax=Microbulbifer hydrolyticus TaxID=48074 RepID=A0A6P1TBD6_9GAMM|nr:hypothetical protein [Microbulbifer hydrolyticus]MBB5210158.1 hypothetical protein [Microbulbifer hydrolyticus]QHQ39327.1 hypothetical protein GTQ55_10235 [Microbulbifer hydrolyticus]
MTVAAIDTPSSAKSRIYGAPYLGLLALTWIVLEKMIAHIYLVTLIYAGIPMAVSYAVAFVVGLLGLALVWKGLDQNEVRGTWMGFVGGSLIWVFWFEMYLHFIGGENNFALAMTDSGSQYLLKEDLAALFAGDQSIPRPYFMGAHVFLQSSTLFCFMLMIYMGMNKDVRCRLILWVRKLFGLRPGKPTAGYKPQYARVAAAELFFVNWFMYTLMLVVNDERILGLHHVGNYVAFAAVAIWSAIIIGKQFKQKEAGLAIRYAIAVGGVFWYLPEQMVLWELFREPWVFYLEFPVTATAILVGYFALMYVFWKTPVNPETGKSI